MHDLVELVMLAHPQQVEPLELAERHPPVDVDPRVLEDLEQLQLVARVGRQVADARHELAAVEVAVRVGVELAELGLDLGLARLVELRVHPALLPDPERRHELVERHVAVAVAVEDPEEPRDVVGRHEDLERVEHALQLGEVERARLVVVEEVERLLDLRPLGLGHAQRVRRPAEERLDDLVPLVHQHKLLLLHRLRQDLLHVHLGRRERRLPLELAAAAAQQLLLDGRLARAHALHDPTPQPVDEHVHRVQQHHEPRLERREDAVGEDPEHRQDRRQVEDHLAQHRPPVHLDLAAADQHRGADDYKHVEDAAAGDGRQPRAARLLVVGRAILVLLVPEDPHQRRKHLGRRAPRGHERGAGHVGRHL